MESKAAVNVQIYFKDKQNELKGPFTERQVQEWYRKKWFENSFPFYFTEGDEEPNDNSQFHTLSTLRSLNGSGCPFKPIDAVSRRGSMEEKLARLEKNVADLSKDCDDVKKLEKRVEDMQKRLETLSAPPSTTIKTTATSAAPETVVSKKPAANAAKKKEKKQNMQHVEWANQWLEFYLDCLDETVLDNTNKRFTEMLHLMHTKVFKSTEATEMCLEVMIRYFKMLPYFFCSSCDVVCQNYKQIFLHMSETQRDSALWEPFLETLIGPECQRLKKEEVKTIVEMHSKYSHLDAHAPNLHPTMTFIDRFAEQYGNAVYGSFDLENGPIMSEMIPRLQKHVGRKMMNELHEHIGNRQTRCYNCCVVTGTREEYYKHLHTHSHLMEATSEDLITLVVNMYQKKE